MRKSVLCLLLPFFIAAIVPAAQGQATSNGSAVCTASDNQSAPKIVSDGAGGAIVTWQDNRVGVLDIYAQRILGSGVTDLAWPTGGRALCTAPNEQRAPAIVSNGAGGAIVTWQDYRNGIEDIYAQRILASGVADPAWPLNGQALCTAASYQVNPRITSDGAGGAIVVWADYRNGNYDIYAQRVLASGALDPAWPLQGRALCTATGDQSSPAIVSDGAGGAVAAWHDARSGNDIYAQRILGSGVVDPAWPADGRALCTAPSEQSQPTLVSDGMGGAIVTWFDRRNTAGGAGDIYAQRVLASGAVDPDWPANGRALCTAPGEQQAPISVSDDAGGAIITWQDYRSGAWNIYAQRVLASGVVDPLWPPEGQAVGGVFNHQVDPTILSDGVGGAIIAWSDLRNSVNYDIYAQRILASGAVHPTWPLEGRVLSAVRTNQVNPTIASDGAGGAVVAWGDYRSGTDSDIYAQGVSGDGITYFPDGEVPKITAVRDIPNDQGGRVKVSWKASSLDGAAPFLIGDYWIWRSAPPRLMNPSQASLVRDPRAMVNSRGPAYLVTGSAGSEEYWELVAKQQAGHLSQYSYVASTTSDSVSGSNPLTAFMIQAWGGGEWWFSNVDSGYSVDNLPPRRPPSLTAEYRVSANLLHWGGNLERDLWEYRLYRGTELTFVPGPGNLVYSGLDTMLVDTASPASVYKLSAVDIHGNESRFALATSTGSTTGVAFAVTAQTEPTSVTLDWYVIGLPGTTMHVYRRTDSTPWQGMATVISDAVGMVRYRDEPVQPGQHLGYRLGMMDRDVEVFSDETWVTVPEARLALLGVAPNPMVADAGLQVRLSLPQSVSAKLQVLDISGRVVATQDLRSLGAGVHEVKVAWERRPSAGIFWVRLTQDGRSVAMKVGILR